MPDEPGFEPVAPRCWFTVPDHPRGASDAPCFEVVGSMVYPSDGHPHGPSAAPWYQLRDDLAFAVDGHPGGPSNEPAFLVRERFVFPLPGPGGDDVPWFRVDERPGRSAVSA
jgi:hypothetical protein